MHCLIIAYSFFTSLFNLYNLLENPYSRFFVYMKALNLALDGKVTEHIVPSCKRIDSFLKEWNIEIKDRRELFLAVANVLKENKRYSEQFIHPVMKLMFTFILKDIHRLVMCVKNLCLF